MSQQAKSAREGSCKANKLRLGVSQMDKKNLCSVRQSTFTSSQICKEDQKLFKLKKKKNTLGICPKKALKLWKNFFLFSAAWSKKWY